MEIRLSEEAPEAWDAYRRFWLVLQGSAAAVRRELTGDKPPTRMRSLRKQCNGFDLGQIEVWESNKYSGDTWAANSQYSFALTRNQDTSPWVISNLERISGSYSVAHASAEGLLFGAPQIDITALVRSPHFKLDEVVPTPLNGEQLVGIRYSFSGQENNQLRGGWILLDPKHDWVIRKSQATLGGRGKQNEVSLQNEYKEGSNHHPIITRISVRSTVKEKDRLVEGYEITSELDLHEQEVVPEKEFMLSAFGLPEPGARQATRWYLWLGGFGLGCLVLGLIVAHLRHRLREA